MVVPKIDICISGNCNILTITDKTGAYDATTNPTGYQSSDISGATAATIELLDSDGTSLGSASVYSTLPNSDEPSVSWGAAGLSSNFGLSSFSDQVYYVKYTVTISGTDYSTTEQVYVTCNTAECVMEMFADLDTCNSKAAKFERQKAMTAWTFLKVLEYQAACGNISEADKTKTFVNKLCGGTAGCSSC